MEIETEITKELVEAYRKKCMNCPATCVGNQTPAEIFITATKFTQLEVEMMADFLREYNKLDIFPHSMALAITTLVNCCEYDAVDLDLFRCRILEVHYKSRKRSYDRFTAKIHMEEISPCELSKVIEERKQILSEKRKREREEERLRELELRKKKAKKKAERMALLNQFGGYSETYENHRLPGIYDALRDGDITREDIEALGFIVH